MKNYCETKFNLSTMYFHDHVVSCKIVWVMILVHHLYCATTNINSNGKKASIHVVGIYVKLLNHTSSHLSLFSPCPPSLTQLPATLTDSYHLICKINKVNRADSKPFLAFLGLFWPNSTYPEASSESPQCIAMYLNTNHSPSVSKISFGRVFVKRNCQIGAKNAQKFHS